jgi:hypothetical protein
MFGNPETTPGGRALKFYSSVRLDIRRIETLKEGVEAIGNRVRVKVVKNKVAPPFKQAEFDIIYGSGISWEGTVLDVGLERKIVQKSGSYFSFEDERLGQGRQNATAFLREHPDVCQQILARIQAEADEGQIVSARLLPSVAPATEVEPVDESVEPDAEPDAKTAEQRLLRAGFDAAACSDALARASEAGYLDDARVATERARRLAERGSSDAAIRVELGRRGVSEENVELALSGVEPESERADRLAARLGGGARAARALGRKGYPEDLVERTIRLHIAE